MWQELSEALLLLLPMVDLARLRRAVLRVLPRPQSLLSPLQGFATSPVAAAAAAAAADGAEAGATAGRGKGEGEGEGEGEKALPAEGGAAETRKAPAPAAANAACPVCGSGDMLTAVVALPCRHVFCYYCLRAHTAADVAYACPLDGVRVAALRRRRPVAAAAAAGGSGGRDGGGGGRDGPAAGADTAAAVARQ